MKYDPTKNRNSSAPLTYRTNQNRNMTNRQTYIQENNRRITDDERRIELDKYTPAEEDMSGIYRGAYIVTPTKETHVLHTMDYKLNANIIVNPIPSNFYDAAAASILPPSHLLEGDVAFDSSGEIVGTMPNNGATGGTISTKAGTVTIPAGYTSGGTVSLSGVSDCLAQNILNGKTILGVEGSLEMPTISQDATTKILSIS